MDQEIKKVIEMGAIDALQKKIDSLMWDITNNVWGGIRKTTKDGFIFIRLEAAIDSAEKILVEMRKIFDALKEIAPDNK